MCVDIAQAARMLSTHPRRIKALIRNGELSALKIPGCKSLRIRTAALDSYLRVMEQTHKNNSI